MMTPLRNPLKSLPMPHYITREDSDYPSLLKTIPSAPKQLWVEGDLSTLNDGVRVAVVGARDCTSYGQEVAFGLARDLSRAGLIVVSGLAYGIDTAAHQGALEGGGKTIAVLGSGLESTYPARNRELRRRIERQGAVVTEFSPGTEANAKTFPQRNRIISGLSWGVVVVEAGSKSGSLITTDFAADQGRDVFAVPGSIRSPQSEGTNRLIQNGAKLVMSVDDVLSELKLLSGQSLNLFPEKGKVREVREDFSEGERQILKLLESKALQMDEILERMGISVEKASSLLTSLEISGVVRSLPGSRFEIR